MRAAGRLLRHELVLGLRSRTLPLVALLAPVVLALAASVMYGGVDLYRTMTVTYVDLDQGAASEALAAQLENDPRLEGALKIRTASSVAEARKDVAEGRSSAALVVPGGFTEAVVSGSPLPDVDVIRDRQSPVAGSFISSISSEFVNEARALQLVADVERAVGAKPGQTAPPTAAPRLTDHQVSRRLKPLGFFAPSMATMFLLLTVSSAMRSLLTDMRDRITLRQLASGVRPWHVVAAKATYAWIAGVASLLAMWLVTSLAMGVDWGPFVGVLVMSAAVSLAMVSLSLLVASVATNDARFLGLLAIVTFALLVVGGNFLPPAYLPDGLRLVSLATPNGLSLRGFLDLQTTGNLSTVVAPAAWLVAAGALVIGLAGRRVATIVGRAA
jgi:ABC-2 type transport system permease protein